MFRQTISFALAAGALFVAAPAFAQKSLGLNVHQSIDVGHDATDAAGLTWVRIDLNWFQCEPAQGSYDFSLMDSVVDAAKARGLSVLAVLGYTPTWASSGDGLSDGSINDVPQDGAYPAFVAAAVGHFQDRVSHYELWNEPNLDVFFEGAPAEYLDRVLLPGADAVHATCPSCRVVAPGLASIGDEYDTWLDVALLLGEDKIDIVSGHIYAGFTVDSPGAGSTSDSFLNKLEAHRVLETGGIVVYEGRLSFREVMQKHGVNKPFWLTETGREATLGDAEEEATQTLYYRRVLEAMLSRPWWQNTMFYEAFDEPGSGYEWGVVVHDPAQPTGYVAKPVMAFLQHVTSEQPAFGGTGHDCGDGLDNEGDGLIDYPEDPDCASADSPSEGLPPSEGGGGAGGQPPSAGGSSATGGGGQGGSGAPEDPAASSCSCEVPARSAPVPAAIWLLALGIAITGARRRPAIQGRAHAPPCAGACTSRVVRTPLRVPAPAPPGPGARRAAPRNVFASSS